MGRMENKHQVRLGAVQETLFITLAARARETQRKRPVLRDPRAVEWDPLESTCRHASLSIL